MGRCEPPSIALHHDLNRPACDVRAPLHPFGGGAALSSLASSSVTRRSLTFGKVSATVTLVTPQQTLIEIRIGGDLAGFVARQRSEGRAWRPIATEISAKARIQVSHETLRKWYPDTESAATELVAS